MESAFNDETILDISLRILSHWKVYCHDKSACKIIDKFLLFCTEDDAEKIKELKKRLFMDKDKKLYLLLPLEILHKELKCGWYNVKETDRQWSILVDDFFDWLCSSDKNTKDEIREEFWNLAEANCITQKDEMGKVKFLNKLFNDKVTLYNYYVE